MDGGRLIVQSLEEAKYTLAELLAKCDPTGRSAKKTGNGLAARPLEVSLFDEARRYLQGFA